MVSELEDMEIILLMIKANVTETRTEMRGMLVSSFQPFYR